MKVINKTKGKVTIRRAGVVLSLLPGESTDLNRMDVAKIRELIDYFGLTIEESRDKPPLSTTRPAPKRTVQTIETMVDDTPKEDSSPKLNRRIVSVEPEKSDSELPFEIEEMKEKFDDMTAAELRAECKTTGLTVSGNRKTLIDRLITHFMG